MKSKIKVTTDLVSGENFLSDLKMSIFWLCPASNGKERKALASLLLLRVLIPLCGLPRWLSGQESARHAGDPGSIPGSGRFSGEGNSDPLQYSGLENPMDGGAW